MYIPSTTAVCSPPRMSCWGTQMVLCERFYADIVVHPSEDQRSQTLSQLYLLSHESMSEDFNTYTWCSRHYSMGSDKNPPLEHCMNSHTASDTKMGSGWTSTVFVRASPTVSNIQLDSRKLKEEKQVKSEYDANIILFYWGIQSNHEE